MITRGFEDLPGLFGKWEVSAIYTGDKINKKAWQESVEGWWERQKQSARL